MKAQEMAYQFSKFQERALDVANRYNKLAAERVEATAKKFNLEKQDRYGETSIYRVYEALDVAPGYGGNSDPYRQIEFEDSTFVASFEHNTACNCHPEYETHSVRLPIEWLDILTEAGDDDWETRKLEYAELDKLIYIQIDIKIELLERKLIAEKQKKEAEAAQKKLESEEKERKTYERLKEKYESQGTN